MFCTCSSADRAAVSGTACRGFDSLQVRYASGFRRKPGVWQWFCLEGDPWINSENGYRII